MKFARKDEMFACVHSKHGNLLTLAAAFSPLMEQTAPHTVVFSIDGLERLMGAPHQIASEICRQGTALGMVQGSLAIAHNPDTAVLLARGKRGVTIVPPGQEADYLADIPLMALAKAPEHGAYETPQTPARVPIARTAHGARAAGVAGVEAAHDTTLAILETFQRWGIHTLGALGDLPEMGLAERFGEEGVRLRRLALGQTRRMLHIVSAENKFERRQELDDSITLLEPLLFVLSALLHELTADLQRCGLAANRVHLVLELEDGSRHERRQEFALPLREAPVLLKLLQLDLEKHPPRSAVVAVHMDLNPASPQIVQHALFTRSHPAPQKLQLALTRIAALVGEHNVGVASLLNTHRPGAFAMLPFSPSPGLSPQAPTEAPGAGSALNLAFRRFRPALPAAVILKQNKPAQVAAGSVRGTVLTASGPWRSSGEWWTETRWARDEWDVDLSDGGVYLLSCQISTQVSRAPDSPAWMLEGVYD